MEEAQIMRVVKQEVVDQEESSPSIKLGLAIGVHGGCNDSELGKRGSGRRRSEFTVAQLEELEQQRLIFKYIASGLPAPLHLVLPIWKSVAVSFGSSNAAFYQQYPSFLGYGSFDYRSKMDPEPGRCRRTDGKKWRCSRDAVPDEKYCEKHMHRGRHRSRKPVETSEVTSSPSTKLPKNSEDELLNSKKNLQIPTPKGLQFMAQSSNVSVGHGPTTFSNGYHELVKNISTVAYTTRTPSYITAATPAAAATATTAAAATATTAAAATATTAAAATATTAAAATATTAGPITATASAYNGNNLWIGVKDYTGNHASNYGIIRGSRNNINVGSNISHGSGFSPKSVLQGGHMIVNCNGVYFDNGSGEELEPGRCRRTDGKKWRCKRGVLPDQKYCDRHIHRGVKQMRASLPVAAASTSAAAMNTTRPCQTTAIAGETDCAIPNTILTMSIPARSPMMQNDEKSNSSSDSDATITDTSLAAYEQLI